MKIAMLGGSFDPIHLGHLMIADEVMWRLGYDRVLFVPAWISPHKSDAPTASPEQRMEMLRLSVDGRPEFAIDSYELDNGGVSYTFETLRHLRMRPDLEGQPGLIIGADLVAGFASWRNVEEIGRLATIIVLNRPGSAVAMERPYVQVPNLPLEVSSTEIRRRVRTGEPYRYLVAPGVYEYIRNHGLYRAG